MLVERSLRASAVRILVPVFMVLALVMAPRAVHCAPAVQLGPTFLEAKGIDMKMFALVALSRDGNILVAMERTRDASLRQRSISHVLRVFRFTSGRLARLDTIPVPIAGLQQVALAEDGSKALAIGESGSKFAMVDLVQRKATVLWQHRRGSAGFRSEPVVAWWQQGSFYLLGYLHNDRDQVTFEGVVRLNPARADAGAFEPRLDLRQVRRSLGSILFETVVGEGEAYFGVVRRPGQIEIHEYRSGRMRRIDTVRAVGGIASSPGRLMYAARFDNGSADVVLVDASGRTWHVGRDNLPFSYLFLSQNGRTMVMTLIDFRAKTMSYFYGFEGDGFRVRPLRPLLGIRPGTLRLSGDGRVYAFYGADGLIHGTLP